MVPPVNMLRQAKSFSSKPISVPLHRKGGLFLSHEVRPEARMRKNWTIVLAKPSYQLMLQAFDDVGLESPDLPIAPRLLL
jgi:hypothetical protein